MNIACYLFNNSMDKILKFDKFFTYKSNNGIQTAQISENSKYIVIGGQNKKMKIFYLNNHKLIKTISQNAYLSIIRFTYDSKYILSGNRQGYLECYDISRNFKIIYQNKVHDEDIDDIIPIDSVLILTSSSYDSIRIINIKKKQLLLSIDNSHKSVLIGVAYHQIYDYIISYSYNQNIKFFNRTDGILKFQYYSPHENLNGIAQMQLVSDKNLLITTCLSELYIWKIDIQNLQLFKVKKFNNLINCLACFLDQSRLVVIFDEFIGVLDYDLNIIQKLKYHKITDLQVAMPHYFTTRQLRSPKYIIVPGTCNYNVDNLQVFKII